LGLGSGSGNGSENGNGSEWWLGIASAVEVGIEQGEERRGEEMAKKEEMERRCDLPGTPGN
jgi:hypothetical protein